MARGKRFYALDSFRGVCALAVVLYHLHVVGSVTELTFFANADLFVEFFFVLSGFVITHAYGSVRDLDFRTFFILRTFRLVPLHLALLAVFVVFEFVKLLASHKGFVFNKQPFTAEYSPSQILPNFLLIQAWTHFTENLSFNYPSWSISIEYYMYLIFAGVSIFYFAHRKFAWFGISLGAFLLLYNNSGVLTDFAYKGLSCFFAGALAYSVFDAISKKLQPSFVVASVLEVLSLCLIVATLSADLADKAIVSSVLFCCVIVLYAFDAGIISSLLKTNVFTVLGRLSYSIYLTHVIILSGLTLAFLAMEKKTGLPLAPMVRGSRYIDSGNVMMNNLIVVLVLLSVVAISYVTYALIEVNGQKAGRYLIKSRPQNISLPINPTVQTTAPVAAAEIFNEPRL